MTASLVLLTPKGAFAGLALVAPLVLLGYVSLRVARVRSLLGLAAPAGRTPLAALAIALLVGLLALAAAQPALVDHSALRVRTDAAAMFVIDISGSMQAALGRHGETRLERARAAAIELRASIPEVPSGIATLTDQLLPSLLPVPDAAIFDSTLQHAIKIEQPAPYEDAVVATDFGQLSQLAEYGYFVPSVRKRVVVLLTDGESNPLNDGAIGTAFAHSPATRLIAVQFWNAGERIYDEPDGGPDPGYRPNPQARQILDELAAATGGKVFSESDLGGAAAALSADLGASGPTVEAGQSTRDRPLAPYVALASLLPLAVLLRRRVV